MKSLFLLLPLLLAFTAPTKPTRVVFFGDSITEAGARPGGYILKIQEMLAKQNRAADYELIGKGIGGNKVYDLYLRMEDDVLALKPDVVVIYIGVNDVWHKSTSGTGTDAPKFVKFYEALIRKLQAGGSKVILCTPAVIGERTDNSNEQDGDLNAYSTMIRELATKQNLPLVDLRKAFIDYNLQNNPTNKDRGILTTDRVHLNETGNLFVAEQMLAAIEKR
ncbi:SGNH/GDSL hydrolase family protein [Fibrella forsythiae]|uniref:SGNH/GDSL hydrolase family protein n=1 Tax=Fibrella forsythiae TaxID=2817061 RepID=A0ABS3JKD7_9BACT|nr:SGNH/GDSL hydrolase family protein [Fibrella forsythiae]MBO0949367.1 SGNH/GDSL hydrolase family protein [Fibrella forsythiae]